MRNVQSPNSHRLSFKEITPAETKGVQPFSRIKSSIALGDDGKLFLFGGFDEDDILDSDVYILDINTREWVVHKHYIQREGHSSLHIGKGQILVYGGIPEDESHREFNNSQLLIYDIKTNTWNDIKPHGITVPERSRHAACLSEDGTKMFISGGLSKSNLTSPFDDLYCYDISTQRWEGSRKFISRFDHSIYCYDHKIWSFGGLTEDMGHVKEISWFDLVTNTTGAVYLNELQNLIGEHMYLKTTNEALLLDVVVPMWNDSQDCIDPCIAYYDIRNLRWQPVLGGSFKPLLGYKWRHSCQYNSKLYLIGYPSAGERNAVDGFNHCKLSTILSVELADLGIVDSKISNGASISKDLSTVLFDKKHSDFQIVGIIGDKRPSLNSTFVENRCTKKDHSSQLLESPNILRNCDDTFVKSEPLYIHKAILLARWPHFRRILASGMLESQKNVLFISEPVSWLKPLIIYLYTNKVPEHDSELCSALLILANLYELPDLRKQCLEAIYSRRFTVKNVLVIWSRAKLVNEEVLLYNTSVFCFYNWSKIVHSKQFEDLSKEDIVELCQQIPHHTPDRKSPARDEDGVIFQNFSAPYNGSLNHYALPMVGLTEEAYHKRYEDDVDLDSDIEIQTNEIFEDESENSDYLSRGFTETPPRHYYYSAEEGTLSWW